LSHTEFKPDSKFESEDGFRDEVEASGEGSANDKLTSLPKRDLPLALVLDACSDLRDLSRDGDIRHWHDFLATVEFARPMLGISPSAWAEARAVMGDQQAAITLAAMLQRAAEIKNAGGYLRNLTERAKEGKFSTWPMVMALLRAKLEGQKKSAQVTMASVAIWTLPPDRTSWNDPGWTCCEGTAGG
jgi:Replication protein C C-terminal region.